MSSPLAVGMKGSGAMLPTVVGAFIVGFALGVFMTSLASRAHQEVAAAHSELAFSRRAPHLTADERLALLERRLVALEMKGREPARVDGGRKHVEATDLQPDNVEAHDPSHLGGGGAAAKAMPTAGRGVRSGSGGLGAHGSPGARKCGRTRRPYHVILTAQDSLYQAWQTRIMYYHFQKQKKLDQCGEMGGFTRMLNSKSGKGDGLMSEMPTVIVEQLAEGDGCRSSGDNTCDFGFPVMNRPHGVQQLLNKIDAGEVPQLVEDYVLIAETDHVMLRPIPNRATPEMPACFPFGYMNPTAPELRPIVERWAKDPSKVDPCGPSPVLIHLPMLRRLTPDWLRISFELKRDDTADRVFGWVLEMWGYTIAAAQQGIKHYVWKEFQQEPSALWHANLDGNPYIYHYTFGLEYTADGIPVTTVGEWSLDKRHFMGSYPSPTMLPPPKCASKAAKTLHALFVEAATNLSGWPQGGKGTTGWTKSSLSGALTRPPSKQSPLVRAIVSRGPWSWAGKSPLLFYHGGRLHSPWGSGSWSLADSGAVQVVLGQKCGSWTLKFAPNHTAFTASALDGRQTSGTLSSTSLGNTVKELDEEPDGIVGRLLGSGPWAWSGVSPLGFLAGGRLYTPWAEGTWGVHPHSTGAIFANFLGEEHKVHFGECWTFTSTRKRDGDKATGGALIGPEPVECPELLTAY